jgi:neutral ceramidase
MAIVPREEDCQGDKPIFLRPADMDPPWTPHVLPVQLALIGQLAMIVVPFECTTMAGRRLRIALENTLRQHGVGYCVIAGLANAYGGYLTTPEEYALQHYEGASTEFGPWQLGALQQIAVGLATWLTGGEPMKTEQEPEIEVSGDFQLQFSARNDAAPLFWKLGDPLKDARSRYKPGERVKVAFWGGDPANDFQVQTTFLEVREQASGDSGEWKTIARDWDPETRFLWKRLLPFLPFGLSTVEWHIPGGQEPGTYQIVHHGRGRTRSGEIRPYTGTSRPFTVAA